MTERAAHLVDQVFPNVPVRQWVLSLPPRVRYVLAWDHALCRAVVAVLVPAGARDRLERLCRYALRPPLAQDRLQLMPDGQAVLELRRRRTDGTTHLIFDPVELLERLAALIPRPRINLVLYHGVLAPRSAWRPRVVPSRVVTDEEDASCDAGHSAGERAPNRTWADLMQRGFGFDVLACPRCSGRLTLIALIRAPDIIERILRHLHLPDAVPVMRPSRDPPLPLDDFDDRRADDD